MSINKIYLANSSVLESYEPEDQAEWEKAKIKFKSVCPPSKVD